jgi:hypothetical protein
LIGDCRLPCSQDRNPHILQLFPSIPETEEPT